MNSVTVIGGVLVDVILELPGSYLVTHGRGSAITLPYGEKLPAKSHQIVVGGSGANVAVGLAKLGYDTTLRAQLSSDALGEYLRGELNKLGVALLDQSVNEPTPVSVVLRSKGDRTIVTSAPSKSAPSSGALSESGWLHLGPLPEKIDNFLAKLSSHRLQSNQGLSLNPSMFQIEERSRQFLATLKTAQVVFLNLKEAQRLARAPQTTSIADIFRTLHSLGPEVICITDGEKGAYASNGEHIWFAEAICDQLCRIDATGAGDSFASGFLAGWIDADGQDDDICERSLKMGMLNSGSVVASIGGQSGLLSRPEIERDLGTVKIKLIR